MRKGVQGPYLFFSRSRVFLPFRDTLDAMRRQLISAVFSSKTADAVLAVLASAAECENTKPLADRLREVCLLCLVSGW